MMMMRAIVPALLLGLGISSALAGEAKVSWQDPDKFMDIRPSNGGQAAFRERVFSEFGRIFNDLAKKLPDGYQLQVNVTDLDLAGEVWPARGATGREIRIIRDVDWPRISFSYQLNNAEGKEILSGKEDLADMNFRSKPNARGSTESFTYEESMLSDWFALQQRNKVFPVK